MSLNKTPLVEAFLEDHKRLTRGLSHLVEALEEDDVGRAAEIAAEVDRLAGSHIEFEERFFYPHVEVEKGCDYVTRLRAEHRAGQKAVKMLVELGDRALGEGEKRALRHDLELALEHAVSCGTLLSHVTTLDAERQDHLLEKLFELRRQGKRWTDLSGPASSR